MLHTDWVRSIKMFRDQTEAMVDWRGSGTGPVPTLKTFVRISHDNTLRMLRTSLCFSIVANNLAVKSLPAYGCPNLTLVLRWAELLFFVLFFLEAALFWPFFLPAGTYTRPHTYIYCSTQHLFYRVGKYRDIFNKMLSYRRETALQGAL